MGEIMTDRVTARLTGNGGDGRKLDGGEVALR